MIPQLAIGRGLKKDSDINGWIKINSEADWPEPSDKVWEIYIPGEGFNHYFARVRQYLNNGRKIWMLHCSGNSARILNVTHYRKPVPPTL